MTAVVASLDQDLDAARDVLATEAAGLRALAAALDATFSHAVALLAGASGRVVVTGMGKSGHIARKIAATFASTGTPALFVHPAEASHGDLGMLVAVTGRAGSTLAQAADAVLLLPAAREACPLGLAPTTSTTMQLALGDALAVALLTRRGFGSSDFRRIHPGGRLGARLRRVRDLMHTGDAMPLAPPDLAMDAALLRMTERRFGCLGIVGAGGRLVGIVTDGDLRRAMGPDLLRRRVGEIMTHGPRTIGPDALAAEALHAMNAGASPITTLFVVDARQVPLGILHIHDLLRAGAA